MGCRKLPTSFPTETSRPIDGQGELPPLPFYWLRRASRIEIPLTIPLTVAVAGAPGGAAFWDASTVAGSITDRAAGAAFSSTLQ